MISNLEWIEGLPILNFCKCGCGTLIPFTDSLKRKVFFVKGHSRITKERIHSKKPYKMIYRPNHKFADNQGRVYLHRIIFEEYYKCCLLPWIDIHHISDELDGDGFKINNIENLEPIYHDEHASFHHIEIVKNRKRDWHGRFM